MINAAMIIIIDGYMGVQFSESIDDQSKLCYQNRTDGKNLSIADCIYDGRLVFDMTKYTSGYTEIVGDDPLTLSELCKSSGYINRIWVTWDGVSSIRIEHVNKAGTDDAIDTATTYIPLTHKEHFFLIAPVSADDVRKTFIGILRAGGGRNAIDDYVSSYPAGSLSPFEWIKLTDLRDMILASKGKVTTLEDLLSEELDRSLNQIAPKRKRGSNRLKSKPRSAGENENTSIEKGEPKTNNVKPRVKITTKDPRNIKVVRVTRSRITKS